MKNTKKVLFCLLCAALCAVIFACASGGGGGGAAAAAGPSEAPAVFTFEALDDSNDKGTSTITMTTAEETIDGVKYQTWSFKGNVTSKYQYGLATVALTPDEATLALLKTAKAISFKMLTKDGRSYKVEAPISTVKDWGFHCFTVKNEANQVAEHKIEMRMFMQPSWAAAVRFNRDRLEMLRIQTINAAEGGVGPFEFKVWDFKVYQ